ncbi:MAG: hypothetical protein VR70_05855 [Rhodospirillaceae bacterium BRH_c57]|nr:MAG: hypothetical protein VR70_05855 [Rhodospirillaceae bacterium BRH_c57]
MAVTQAQLNALVAAWASGVLTVKEGDNQTTYRTQDDMERAIARMSSALGVSSPISPPKPTKRTSLTRFRKG